MTRIAINGFGRIGRNVLRALLERGSDLEVVAVNDLTEPAALARLLAYDTTAGRLGRPVTVDGDVLVVDGRRITVLAEREPAKLPWAELGVDIVLEATGRFATAKAARAHLDAGARKVLVSAPADGADVTLAYGVNTDAYDPALHTIVSNASCTTNALAPLAAVLDELAGIEHGFMTTVHAYTQEQNLQDGPHRDPRRARPAQVAVRAVLQVLLLRVGVHGGHEAVLDAGEAVEHRGEGCQCVRGARRVRDDGVEGGVVRVAVHAIRDSHVGTGRRSADQHPLGPSR